MKNTYAKFCPNVFLAKCTETHEAGEIITMSTRHGSTHEAEIFNLIYERDGFFYYSVIRADGFNMQERARRKSERLAGYAANAEKRAQNYYNKSNEGADFLKLAEPIKIGHHSEKRHRALIERNRANFGKYVNETNDAETYEARAEYWAKKENDVNLSMPESIEFFAFKLEAARKYHADMKAGKIERRHSMSLQYAKKAVNEAEKNYNLALKLWQL